MTEGIGQIEGIDPGDRTEDVVPRVLGVLESRLEGARTLAENHASRSDETAPRTGEESSGGEAALYNLPRNVAIRFVLDEETQEVSALVVDRESGEIIRTVPPEKLLELVRKGGRVTGLFVEARL